MHFLPILNIVLCLCIFAPFLPLTRSNEYPECKYGGVREFANGRTFCNCPQNRVNTGPLCETVRVNFENLQTPLTAIREVTPTLPLHISLEFICKDFRGTGVLFTLGDYKKGLVLELALNYGQPVIALNSRRQTATVGSLHDNEWHRLDLFMAKTPIGVDVTLIVDRCVDKRRCGRKLTFNGITTTSSTISGPLALNTPSIDGHRLSELCLENIVINSELVDLFEATTMRLRARGCPKCEEACFFSEAFNSAGRCGSEGICRNPIVAAIDQYVCTCRPGYQPVLQKDHFNGSPLNTSIPCAQPVLEWQIDGPNLINIGSKGGFTLYLSLRTRQQETPVLRSRDGRLRLVIYSGKLALQLDTTSLLLPGVDLTDGWWHVIQLTVTPVIQGTTSRMVDLTVDGLWNAFHNATLSSTEYSSHSDLDGILIIEAISSCLSDVRLEMRDTRNNIIHDYLLSDGTEERQSILRRGCETVDLCASSNPCGPLEICIPEWRGYKCICKAGSSHRIIPPSTAPQCVLSSCHPNPCQNSGECLILENETISWENETVGVLCVCSGGWTGLFCERPALARSGLQNWWLIPFFFVLILIVFWIVFYACWWKRRKLKNMASTLSNGSRFIEQQERMTLDSIAKAGEEDYRGSLNLSALKVPDVSLRPEHLTVRGMSVETRPADSMLSAEGERFLAMDQPLQYAFEGYDSSPPPNYFFNSTNSNGNQSFDFSKRAI
ncbi:Neural-cadherin [Echinococcus granulosus]|uniref:Cj cadherin n=1 Tax=Echinococcus granulosus TaxID=6210 RepID=A0A068WUF8_ECHGR|nr:Neural-cadherin [Echinococcus granulosus]CDS22143.1 cj cadherin [Echinococcus granulosus]